MRKSIFMGLGLALSVAGTAIAQAPQDGQRPARGERGDRAGQTDGRRQGGPDGLLLKDITLTEGQRTQIAQLRKTQREQMQAKREQGQKQGETMRAARERGDTAAVRQAMQQRRQVMEQQRTQHIASLRNILSAEQRVQFDKNIAELKAREAQRAERGHRMGARGKGPAGERGVKPTRSGT
jgi:Spy/CpxP family protein refolding chaperone